MTPDKTMDVQQLAEQDAKTLANECARLRAEVRGWKFMTALWAVLAVWLLWEWTSSGAIEIMPCKAPKKAAIIERPLTCVVLPDITTRDGSFMRDNRYCEELKQ